MVGELGFKFGSFAWHDVDRATFLKKHETLDHAILVARNYSFGHNVLTEVRNMLNGNVLWQSNYGAQGGLGNIAKATALDTDRLAFKPLF